MGQHVRGKSSGRQNLIRRRLRWVRSRFLKLDYREGGSVRVRYAGWWVGVNTTAIPTRPIVFEKGRNEPRAEGLALLELPAVEAEQVLRPATGMPVVPVGPGVSEGLQAPGADPDGAQGQSARTAAEAGRQEGEGLNALVSWQHRFMCWQH